MQSPPVLKTALNYGALSGLVSFIVFLILYWMNFNPLGPSSWLGAWVPIIFMVLATRHYRNYENGGFLMYWNGFRISFLTACAAAFVFGAGAHTGGALHSPYTNPCSCRAETRGTQRIEHEHSDNQEHSDKSFLTATCLTPHATRPGTARVWRA